MVIIIIFFFGRKNNFHLTKVDYSGRISGSHICVELENYGGEIVDQSDIYLHAPP